MGEILEREIAKKLVPYKISINYENLDDNQKKLCKYLIKISDIISELYLYQKNPYNIELLEKFKKENNYDIVNLLLLFNGPFNIWTKKSFINDIDLSKYNRKNFFYPENFNINKIEHLDDNLKKEIYSPYYVVKENQNGDIVTIKYSEEYKFFLEKISTLLDEASNFTENYSLKSYLKTLSSSCLNNDFYEADIRWLQLIDNDIEPLIGPYEFYDDNILGVKTAFTSFVAINNKNLTNKITQIFNLSIDFFSKINLTSNNIQNINFNENKLQIVDVIYSGGEGRFPIHSIAYNLPNTKEIKEQFGTKKIIINNIIEAKFESIMKKIANTILGNKDSSKLSYKSYFYHIILHEISHSINLTKISNEETFDPSLHLKDLYGIIEETKADMLGLYLQINLIRESIIFECNIYETLLTYIISLIRTMRFGKENAHSISSIIQWNILEKEKAILILDNVITIDSKKFENIIENYLFIIKNFYIEANYDKTKNFIYSNFYIDEKLDTIIEKIKDIEIDIYPIFDINNTQ